MEIERINGKRYIPKVSSIDTYCKEVYGGSYRSVSSSTYDTVYMKILPEDVYDFDEDVDADCIYTFDMNEGIIEEIGEGISIIENYIFYYPVKSKVLLNKEM